jgi:hypothetical protein
LGRPLDLSAICLTPESLRSDIWFSACKTEKIQTE